MLISLFFRITVIITCLLIGGTVGFDVVSAVEISKKDQKNIVNIHNIYRSPFKIRSLKWSEELRKSSEAWAKILERNNCPLTHSPIEIRNNSGENLMLGWSSSSSYKLNIKEAVYEWGREKSFYLYDSNTCKVGKLCGHYTQMAWKTTTEVGCALAHCDTEEGTSEILVCHYNPPGNYIGEKPY